MKKLLFITGIALLAITAVTGCKKSSNNSSSSYSMTATLGSTAYNAPYCLAALKGSTMIIEGLGGSTTAPTFPYMYIQLYGWNTGIVTAKFTFDSTMTKSYAQYLGSSTSVEQAKSGAAYVTSVTATTISGTFSFTCTDGTVVSNGTFNAQIQK